MNDLNLTLNKQQQKLLSQAIGTHIKSLERMVRTHQNVGRTAVADLILVDASVLIELKQKMKE